MNNVIITSIGWLITGLVVGSFFVLFRRKLALRHLKKRDSYNIDKNQFFLKTLIAIIISLVLIILFSIWFLSFLPIDVILFELGLSMLIGQVFLFIGLAIYVRECRKVFKEKKDNNINDSN